MPKTTPRPSSAARVRQQQRQMVMTAAEEGMGNLVLFALQEESTASAILQIVEPQGPRDVPLITACLKGHLDVVRNLVEVGKASLDSVADVTLDNGDEQKEVPPLWAAVVSGNEELVRYLIKAGADINKSNATKSTPLRAAVFLAEVAIVKILVENGADVNSVNKHGHSVLMNSCQTGTDFQETAKILLDHGANVEHVSTALGETPLHEAARSGALEVARLLLERGASIAPNNNGETPLIIAALENKDDFFNLFIESPDCSRDDQANALELLGTTKWKDNEVDQCLQLWQRAMKLRHQPGKPVAEKREAEHKVAAYGNAVEVGTPQALQTLTSSRDTHALGVQSMLIRERVLGRENPDTTFLIKYAAALSADNDDFNQAIQLLFHARDNISNLFPFKRQTFLVYELLENFMGASESGKTTAVTFFQLLKALKYALSDFRRGEEARERDKDEDCLATRHQFLKVILHMICNLQQAKVRASAADGREFADAVSGLVKKGVTGEGGDTLLHMACRKDTTNLDSPDEEDEHPVCLFPSVAAVQALLRAGCDVTVQNEAGQTALQVLRQQEGDHSAIVKLLAEAGSK